MAWDYRASGHSPRAHPLEPVRALLRAQGLPTAAEVQAMPDGRRVDYAGLVICRQRPSTANGVVFMAWFNHGCHGARQGIATRALARRI